MELIEVPEDAQVEECIELKNIQYKTMLLNGKPIKETKSANDLTSMNSWKMKRTTIRMNLGVN